MGVEFRILGPLEAVIDGEQVSLGGRRQRAVLAILLSLANETVPVERLIDGVWDDDPPETASNVLQGVCLEPAKGARQGAPRTGRTGVAG